MLQQIHSECDKYLTYAKKITKRTKILSFLIKHIGKDPKQIQEAARDLNRLHNEQTKDKQLIPDVLQVLNAHYLTTQAANKDDPLLRSIGLVSNFLNNDDPCSQTNNLIDVVLDPLKDNHPRVAAFLKLYQKKGPEKVIFLTFLFFQLTTITKAIPALWQNICLAETLRCTPSVTVQDSTTLQQSKPIQQPILTFPKAVKTYSKRPRNVILAKQFLTAPTFEHLVFLTRIDLNQFLALIQVLPLNSDFRELLTDFVNICSLSPAPPKELALWTKHSVIWQIHRAKHLRTHSARLTSNTPVRALFRVLGALPYFLRNLCIQIILEFKLGNLHFLQTYPRFLRNKNSTRELYEGKLSQMADWFELTPDTFGDSLFNIPTTIPDVEILENIFFS